MKLKVIIRALRYVSLIVALLGFSPATRAQQPAERPNVIFILADDLGWGDVGCYGQKQIQTPNLDRIAADGMGFTNAYCGSPLCGPSRSTLFTGLHTGHTAIRHNPSQARGWNRSNQGDPPLADDTVTFARVFKQAGYATACIGKYGMGLPGQAGSPDRLGFDYFFGYDSHVAAHNYYPKQLWRNNAKIDLDGKTYSDDLFTKEALGFVREHAPKPFLLYLPYTIPHGPLKPPSNDPYTGKSWLEPDKAYAAMITRMDSDIGKLDALLAELHLTEKTLIIFTSDNGADNVGQRKIAFFKSNGEFRGKKGTAYEGGIRVPFIARWPGHIARGKTADLPIAFWDFLPTCCELVGVPAPASTDGVSYLPTLLGRSSEQKQHAYLYWELAAAKGFQEIRMGDWKAEIHDVSEKAKPRLELYDLKSDPSEQHDVAAEHPEIVRKMQQIATEAHTSNKMFPLSYAEAQAAAPKGATPKNQQSEE